MKAEIKAYRPIHGHDGQGFEAKLYLDGIPAAFVFDDGWGGEYQYQPISAKENYRSLGWKLFKALEEEVLKSFPAGSYFLGNFDGKPSFCDWNIDLFVGDLIAMADGLKASGGAPFARKAGQSNAYEIHFFKVKKDRREWAKRKLAEKYPAPEWEIVERALLDLEEIRIRLGGEPWSEEETRGCGIGFSRPALEKEGKS